jgi:outer membrane protein OmpA-like peptidoglycan-associated protein
MRRRAWLVTLAVAASLPSLGRPARGAEPEAPPASVDRALDQLETLISPEALAAFHRAPEDDVRELHMGVLHLYLSRGWAAPAFDEYIPSLAADLKARQVPPSRGYQYLLTALWRRKHGLPLETPVILTSIERQERIQTERIKGSSVIDDRESFLWMRVNHFEEDSVRPRPDAEVLDYVFQAIQKPTSICALAQVQGHASADEPDPRGLSLARARAVVARLVQRGVTPSRLTAHGLGTRFPRLPLTVCPSNVPREQQPPDCVGPRDPAARAPGRDRRVEILCLRRHWVPPIAGHARPSP